MKTNRLIGSHPPPLHPFLLGTFFVLTCSRECIGYLRWWELPVWLGVVLLLVAGLWTVFRLSVRHRYLAGILTTEVVLLLGFYSTLHAQLAVLFDETALRNAMHDRYVLPLVLGAVSGVLWWLRRSPRRLLRLKLYLNVASFMLVVATALQCAFLAAVPRARSLPPLPPPDPSARPVVQRPAAPPDVYYILLDAYTSGESLRKHWGYDNAPFLEDLARDGFQVVTNARGNYANTLLCQSSALNLNYLSVLPHGPWSIASQLRFGRKLERSEVVDQFRNAGYEVVNLSLFDLPGAPRAYTYLHWPVRNFGQVLYVNSLVGHFRGWWELPPLAQINRDILTRLDTLATQPRPKPLFTYAHVMMPHPPYLYDREGRFLPKGSLKPDKAAYLDQLIYLNHLMTNVVARLLTNSKREPIIILQGDHGFRQIAGEGGLEESGSILNAYHLPGAAPDWVFPGISPINSFRLIFNHYFGTHYPYLPDRQFLASPGHETDL